MSTARLPSLLLPPNKRKRSRNKSPATNTPQLSPATANVPNTRDLFKLAHTAWRGVEVKHYDPQHGSDLIKGRDLVQWLLYQCMYPDTPAYREYVIRIAQAFLDKRYLVRITSPLRIMGWVRKRRVNTTFSDDKYLYDFNDVAVSNIHVVVLVECATNLMGRDKNGQSDPLCQVSLGGRQTAKTRVIMSKTSPVWNEVFTFGVRDILSQQLIFEVADYDFGKQADFLGYARLPLINVIQEKVLQSRKLAKAQLQRWTDVSSPGGGGSGSEGVGRDRNNNTNMLRGRNQDVRRDEATSSFGNYERIVNDGSGGGNINDVNLLFGSGNRTFKHAMHELKLGPGPKHSRKHVRGSIRIGAFLRQFNPDALKVDEDENNGDGNGGESGNHDTVLPQPVQKYQLYCRILHARNVHGKGPMAIGNYVPLLRWMNRVGLKSHGQKIYSNYVYKTTGPLWEEILSMEIINIENEYAKIKMYQCGQAKTDARCVGDLTIPLSLIQILHPREKESGGGGGSGGGGSGGGSGISGGENGATPIVTSGSVTGKNRGDHPNQQQHHHNDTDFSLQHAMANDELLASIQPSDIPAPQWMPLTYTWDDYSSLNGDILLSLWMVPKGGSLFGEVNDKDVYATISEDEKITIPLPLHNICCDQIVPLPIALLRSNLWSQDSPVMKAHFDEKGFKDITVGKWVASECDGDSSHDSVGNGTVGRLSPSGSESSNVDDDSGAKDGAIHRELSFMFPASSMVSANMAYEVQTIQAKNDLRGGFVVLSETQNPNVMYGKSFKTVNQFVFEWVGPKATQVRISSQVNFDKRPNGFIASQIENGVAKGTKDSTTMLLDLLMSSAGGSMKKKRKKKLLKNDWKRTIAIMFVCFLMLTVGYFAGVLHHAPWRNRVNNETATWDSSLGNEEATPEPSMSTQVQIENDL